MVKKLVILIGLFVSLYSQDYMITDFKADSLTSWQIYAIGQLSTSHSNQEYAYNDTYNNENDYSFYPRVLYMYLKYRKNSITELAINTSVSVISQSDESKNDTEESFRFSPNFDINLNDTRYLKNNIGVTNALSLYYDNLSADNTRETQDISAALRLERNYEGKQQQTEISYTPGVIFGRIWDAQYSAKAVEIVQELKKAGVLKRDLSNDEFLKLSQTILERKEKFHYDSRIQRNEAYKEIISYLNDLGVIDITDIDPAIIVCDIASYDFSYNRIPRGFGFEAYANLEIGLLKTSINMEDDAVNYYLNISGKDSLKFARNFNLREGDYSETYQSLVFGLRYSQTPSWNFCYNLSTEFRITSMSDEENTDITSKFWDYEFSPDPVINELDDKYNYDESGIQFRVDADFYYQINSRSYFTFDNYFQYEKIDDKRKNEDSTWKNYYENYMLRMTPSYHYYFTPKFLIYGGVEYRWSKVWHKSDDVKTGYHLSRWNASVSIGYYL